MGQQHVTERRQMKTLAILGAAAAMLASAGASQATPVRDCSTYKGSSFEEVCAVQQEYDVFDAIHMAILLDGIPGQCSAVVRCR